MATVAPAGGPAAAADEGDASGNGGECVIIDMLRQEEAAMPPPPQKTFSRMQTHSALKKLSTEPVPEQAAAERAPSARAPTGGTSEVEPGFHPRPSGAAGAVQRRPRGKPNAARGRPDVVQDAISRLNATAEAYGEVYNACSHTYLMVRDSATQDLGVAFRSGEAINPIGVGPIGHIAYRTDDIVAFKRHLDAHSIHYADYGTRFARDWHQIFFLDPVGTIVEVHAVIPS